jgi:hypothetical protein
LAWVQRERTGHGVQSVMLKVNEHVPISVGN